MTTGIIATERVPESEPNPARADEPRAASAGGSARDGSYDATTWAAGSVAVLVGAVTVFAWLSHSDWFWTNFPSMFYMKFNTCLAFVNGGIGLIACLREQRGYAVTAGAIVLLIAGPTLLEYLSGVSLGIDELLLSDYRYPENPLHGRMSPNTTTAFACFGTGLILVAGLRARRLFLVVTMEALGFVVLAIGSTAAAGYLAHAAFAFNWGTSAQVAPLTAAGFMALGIGLLAQIWRQRRVGSAHGPLWVPMLMCVMVFLFDLVTPLGLAAGIAYIPIIFVCLWFFTQPYMPLVFAGITTALTVLGYFAAPHSDFPGWIVVSNRILTIGALWLVATLVYQRRRIEMRMLASMSDLARSNRELDDFAYIASHDLKEPLRGLTNHASFLIEDYGDKIDEDGQRRLNRLGQLCQRMEQLINDLMYFSRLGRADLAVRETDPNAIVAEIQQMMEPLLAEKPTRIVLPRALPRIVCDKTRVTEIFRNLITNAIKYNDKADRLVEIGFLESVDTPEANEENVFYIRDNGIGIASEFHQLIFRIFKRLHNSADGAGTGVGLTFVKKIVERHGGRIWLESELGMGTVFYFNLGSHLANKDRA